MSKLIIIRGNSGSGKSTVAKNLRERLKGQKVAWIEQDHFRRIVLKEKDKPENTDILGLIKQTVQYVLDNDYIVILEGIFSKDKYKDILIELIENSSRESCVFYIDVSLKETLRRHKAKPNAHEFGEKEMRIWYLEKDYLGIQGETIINEKSSLEETVDLMLNKIKG